MRDAAHPDQAGAAAGLALSASVALVRNCRRTSGESRRLPLVEYTEHGAKVIVIAIIVLLGGLIVLPVMPWARWMTQTTPPSRVRRSSRALMEIMYS